jgi:hypothetical protein
MQATFQQTPNGHQLLVFNPTQGYNFYMKTWKKVGKQKMIWEKSRINEKVRESSRNLFGQRKLPLQQGM